MLKEFKSNLDAGNFTAGVFTDLKKAFDTVNHNILLEKLDYYGIRGVDKNWFCSCLNNWKMYVMLNGSTSSIKPASTGVPQGSVQGPRLFLIYINDLNKCVKYPIPVSITLLMILICYNQTVNNLSTHMNVDLKNLPQ